MSYIWTDKGHILTADNFFLINLVSLSLDIYYIYYMQKNVIISPRTIHPIFIVKYFTWGLWLFDQCNLYLYNGLETI